MSILQDASSLLGRMLLSSIFFVSGLPKLFNYAGSAAYLKTLGVPAEVLPVIIGIELVCGLCILLGVLTRVSAVLLALLALATAVTFHRNFGVDAELINFMKNVAIAGGLLILAANGPGRWAVMPGGENASDKAADKPTPAPAPSLNAPAPSPGVAQFPPAAMTRRR